jgi:hypothetical protein
MRPSLTRRTILAGRISRSDSENLFHVIWKATIAQVQVGGTAQTEFVICDQSIENRLHRRRDVTLGEDACQVRMSVAPETLAALNGGVLALMDWLHVPNVAS